MALTKIQSQMLGSSPNESQAVNLGVPIVENTQNITANYSITTGSSAMSVGPLTIASGVTITIPTGSRWVIL